LLTGCGPSTFDEENLCSIYESHPDWEQAVMKSEQRWGIPQEMVMAVIRHESRFIGNAKAPRKRYLGFIPGPYRSTAYGYSQALDPTWKEYQQRTGNEEGERDHFPDAVDFVGWYLNRSHRSLQIPRNDGYHLYLAYHEGHRGFLRRDFENKPRIMRIASKVNNSQVSYRQQLQQCRPDTLGKRNDRGKEKRFTLEINGGKP
jgi:hypothetical protein